MSELENNLEAAVENEAQEGVEEVVDGAQAGTEDTQTQAEEQGDGKYQFSTDRVRPGSPIAQWLHLAYSMDQRGMTRNQREQIRKQNEHFWKQHGLVEKKYYREILSHTEQPMEGTLQELAAHFQVEIPIMAGLIQGGNEALVPQVVLEDLEPDTQLVLNYDLERLYRAMVANKANYLFNLPEWDNILTREKRNELYHAIISANQVTKAVKIGRNDPCPCGSGKKYKQCCGRNV